MRGLAVAAEVGTDEFDRDDFEHHRRYLCDEAGFDPYTGAGFGEDCDVDHIVAAQEMFESGGHGWDVARRREAGNDADNLVASKSCVNRSKGGGDMAEWPGRVASGRCAGLEVTSEGRCFLAWKTVVFKQRWELTVDVDELAALETVLAGCPASGPMPPSPPTGFETPTETSQDSQPPATAQPTAQEEAGGDCHPAYRPCLPNLAGDAMNCGDLSASQRPVTVVEPGIDPYRLDRDGDGTGCA